MSITLLDTSLKWSEKDGRVLCYWLDSKQLADALAAEWDCVVRFAVARQLERIDIYWRGCDNKPYRFPVTLAREAGAKTLLPTAKEVNGLATVRDIDWNAVFGGENAIYISTLSSQDNLFANNTAILCQQKPAQEFLRDKATSLNYPDELSSRCDRIQRDGGITEYEYLAYRWYRGEGGAFLKRQMRFTSNFVQIEYLGQRCWMGEVLQAEPMGVFYASAG